ncbi:Uncharacterized protein Adt_35702 [Abeliophyllum distichum]|uniref:DUF6570 domain-containing protein n=1 Tax=Abeliophyllum distichum TaxID=126358 RepID=A0ABD1QFH1_9LAMI
MDGFATERCDTRSRRINRQRRKAFDSLVIPGSNVCSNSRENKCRSLHQAYVNKGLRAVRLRRTSFTSFIMPITRQTRVRSPRNVNERRARQAIDTARHRKARAEQTSMHRTDVRASDCARRKQARASQTIQQRANSLAIDNARRKRLREGQTSHLRLRERDLHTLRIDVGMLNHPMILSTAQCFRKSCGELMWVSCLVCHISFPGIKSSEICTQCSGQIQRGLNPLKFSAENLMDPGVVPIELSRLTNLEQILIARVHLMMYVYRVKGQQYKYSGNVINFAQDVNSMATVLTFKPSDLSAILIVNRTGAHDVKEFRVRHIPHSDEDNEHNSNANPPTDVVEDDIEGPPEIVNQIVHIDEFHAIGTISVGPQPNQ